MSRNPTACWCKALELVSRQWRGEFTRFVDEGEASAGFLTFLEQSSACRQACEMVLRADAGLAAVVAGWADEPAGEVEEVAP